MPDVVVIGGALAGSAAAIQLARGGARVTLLERDRVPAHKVCGEFLSGPAVAALRALGLDPAMMGGSAIRRVRLADGARTAAAALPFCAVGLSRLRLDDALRRLAAEAGVTVRLGAAVRGLEGGAARLADGSTVRGDAVILATGKHELPRHRRTEVGGMTGFKAHLHLAPDQLDALSDHVELHLHAGGYAGLQRIEDGLANLSFVIDAGGFAMAGRSYEGALTHLAPPGSLLAERLAGHRPAWDRPLAIANVPYGWRQWRAPPGPDWLWRVGDQSAVIPSFTGDGMAMALASAAEAASLIALGARPADHVAAVARRCRRQLRVAGALSVLTKHRLGRAAMLAMVAAWPSAATAAARLTRVAPRPPLAAA